MNIRNLIPALLIAATLLLPFEPASAQIPGVGAVPVSDSALRNKEVGMTLFGVTVPGTSWDSIVIAASKKAISRIVNSTVKWINSGFDGNPAYLSNPAEYFSNLADGIAGEFIQGSDLGLLCSPFQASIKLSLTTQYYEPRPFQCTLTGIIGNIENFYSDFSQGGWDAWFTMTQQPTNNPYGAYLKAKIELDSQIASAIGLKQDQLDWGGGFLSFEKCPANSVVITDPNTGGEKCADASGKPVNKTISTPGTVIEDQLSNVLGTGIRQLELADEFDEIVGALIGQLLEKTIFNTVGGLAGTKDDFEADTYNSTTPGTGEEQCGVPLPLPPGTPPNMSSIVSDVAAEFPELLRTSASNYDFLDKVVERLHAADSNWGYNGKRGDLNNISQDAVAYFAGDVRVVFIFDIIAGHGGANPQPAWQDVTAETYNCGTTGGYVYPRPNNSSAPEPEQPQI